MAHVPPQLPLVVGRYRRAGNRPKGVDAARQHQTTMNVYGKAMTDTKRQAHRKVVKMVLKSKKTEEGNGRKKQIAGIGS